MNNDDVIFIRENDRMLRAERLPYDSEDLLRRLVADHPEILAGSQIRPDDPVQWLLVSREAGINDRADGGDRWSIDHLLLDQDAIPTFAEVKRSTDTRIRREVVGQMLDYAANATAWWPINRIRELAQQTAGSEEALRQQLAELKGSDPTDIQAIEDYWAAVERNLRSGNVRLLFIADEIPRELRRIIEFLNEHMPTVEVLGIEVVRYLHDDIEAFVPRVVGQTERALASREPTPRRKTTMEEFLAVCAPSARAFFERLLAKVPEHGMRIVWGTKGFTVRLDNMSLAYGYPPGTMGRPDTATFQAYLSYLPQDRRADVRATFLDAAPFREAGKHTLELEVDADVAAADRAVEALWKVAASLRSPT